MEDGSAVRIVRPNGVNTRLRTGADWRRATCSGSRFLGKDYTFLGGAVGWKDGQQFDAGPFLAMTFRFPLSACSTFIDGNFLSASPLLAPFQANLSLLAPG